MVCLSTICYLIRPRTAIFIPSSLGMTLGIITPGLSMRNIRGLFRILKPLTPLVVATEAVALAVAFLLGRSEILLIWFIIDDFPTLGVPQIIAQSPTCLYLCVKLSLRKERIFRISSCFLVLTAKHWIP